MRTLVKSLKRLYEAGKLSIAQIGERVKKGSISEDEYKEIIGEEYTADAE